MSEQYKEAEAKEITSTTEGTPREHSLIDEIAAEKPILVESIDNSPNLLAPLDQDPFVGTVLNHRYRILLLIGKGATSSVYRAEDTKSNQAVAIKILHSHLAADATIMRRFEQEAKTARLLRHPNIVNVYGYEKLDNGIPFLVMELAEGTSLQDVLKGTRWLPVERAIDVFIQVCAALATAHEKGIVHRD